VDAICCPQKEIDVNVSRPLKRSHVDIPLDVSLRIIS
jgi:hypothetical protein